MRERSQQRVRPDAFPVAKDGFRLRGTEMTRLETFTDAAFAFAVTLLVVSVESVPQSFDELTGALRALPIFGASFAILMIFWHGHWRWSQRFGMEDGTSTLLSLALVFTVLSYVYPLRYMWTVLTHWISGGTLASDAVLESRRQLDLLLGIYGVGFCAMALVLAALNAHALRRQAELDLDEVERFETRGETVSWLLIAGVGALSATIAISGLGPAGIGGWVYMTMPVLMPGWAYTHYRRRVRLDEALAGGLRET